MLTTKQGMPFLVASLALVSACAGVPKKPITGPNSHGDRFTPTVVEHAGENVFTVQTKRCYYSSRVAVDVVGTTARKEAERRFRGCDPEKLATWIAWNMRIGHCVFPKLLRAGHEGYRGYNASVTVYGKMLREYSCPKKGGKR